MKEATGGALLTGLAAGIILIFIILAAFFISYGKAFKEKNSVINIIEQSEGLEKGKILDSISSKYITEGMRSEASDSTDICYNIVKKKDSVKGFTVKVTLYMQFDRTILGDVFNIKIPISGETRIIEKGDFYDKLVDSKAGSTFASAIGMNPCSS